MPPSCRGVCCKLSGMVTRDDVIARVESLKAHKRYNRESPHKALLILHSLGRMKAGEERLQTFEELRKPISGLLGMFGSPGTSAANPHHPFTALRSDNLWDVPSDEGLVINKDQMFSPAQLLEQQVAGGFPEDVHALLEKDQELVVECAQMLLHRFFSETRHDDILQTVGLLDVTTELRNRVPSHRLKRDPRFRRDVIHAYDAKCAVCSQDLSIGEIPLDIEAAHIRPVCDLGPDIIGNGLALCSLHHKAFDHGVIGIRMERELFRIIVSRQVGGSDRQLLLDLNDEPINVPERPKLAPKLEFVEHHFRNYFRQPQA